MTRGSGRPGIWNGPHCAVSDTRHEGADPTLQDPTADAKERIAEPAAERGGAGQRAALRGRAGAARSLPGVQARRLPGVQARRPPGERRRGGHLTVGERAAPSRGRPRHSSTPSCRFAQR